MIFLLLYSVWLQFSRVLQVNVSRDKEKELISGEKI